MKSKIIIFIGIIIFLFGIAWFYVSSPSGHHIPTARTSYLFDLTDSSFKIIPERTDIIPTYSWNPLNQARVVRLRNVTNISQENVQEFSLPAYHIRGDLDTWDIMSNDIFRQDEIQTFEDTVWNTIDSIYKDKRGYENTSLLAPMVEELINLQQFPGDDRILAIFSDNTENMPGFSFLDSDTLGLLKAESMSLWNSIPRVDELKNLSGITVYFIYSPRSAAENNRYDIITGYLKRRIQSYGGTVIVQGKVTHTKIGQ